MVKTVKILYNNPWRWGVQEFIVRKRSHTVQRTCRIEEELLDRIEDVVDICNLPSVNSLVNECIRFALDNMFIEK